jgi:hypothetical protein
MGVLRRSKTPIYLFAVGFDRRHKDRGIRAAALSGAIQTEHSRYLDDEARQELTEIMTQVAELPGAKPIDTNRPRWVSATSGHGRRWSRRLTRSAGAIAGCHVAGSSTRGFPLGVRPYALDPARAQALWAKSEEMVGERCEGTRERHRGLSCESPVALGQPDIRGSLAFLRQGCNKGLRRDPTTDGCSRV